MKRFAPLLLLCLFSACSGGGGGNEGDNKNKTNDPNSGGNPDAAQFYQKLDEALAARTVSTATPAGLWMIYSKGTTAFQSSISSGSLDRDETVYLFAFVASVYVLENSGDIRMAINDCTGNYHGNNVNAHAGQATASFDSFTLDLKKLVQMATLYPYHPGDMLLDDGYQAFLDTDFDVTLTENKEMTFPGEFSFTDNDGDSQGHFTAIFKARKFSDDFKTDLGQFTVNAVDRGTHCLTYLNQSNDETTTSLFQGTTSVTESAFVWEKFNIVSFPEAADGISGFLYQDRSAFDMVINGQNSPAPRATAVAVTNTNDQFVDTSVTSALSSHLVDLTYRFNVQTGLTMDYTVSDGASTLTGTLEALY